MPNCGSAMSSTAGKTVLVTGATGRQGGAVIRHMRGTGWSLRALVLNPSSDAAGALAREGIELVQGDFDDSTRTRPSPWTISVPLWPSRSSARTNSSGRP